MSNGTRTRINAAFDDELSVAPVPAGLRALSIRDAVAAPRRRAVQPQLMVIVATIVVIAVVVTFVIGSHVLRSTPIPAEPPGSVYPPSSRTGADMVYDAAHQELVLFGGMTIDNRVVNETWTWDGKVWRIEHPKAAPAARPNAVMAYDAARRDVVLFGGRNPASGKGAQLDLADTWTWDGTTWHLMHPAHQPVFGYSWQPPVMDFDPVSRTVIAWGFTKDYKAQTWTWNGSDWSQLMTAGGPTQIGAMVGGGTNIYLIALSAGRVGGHYANQMWRWDGASWNLLPPNDNSPALGPAAYDPQRGRIVALTGDTWTWDGSTWTRQHVQDQPPTVGYLAYFPPLHQVISYGSLYGNTSNDVWAWTGSTWVRLEAGTVGPLPTPSGQLGPTTPAAAEALIRQTVKNTSPVLLPGSLPSGMEAKVTNATPDSFNVDYRSDQRDKTVSLGIVVANPPPGDANSSDTHVTFRKGAAEYFVYDPSASLSDRWLIWYEPGTMASPQTKQPNVVPYFLSASGLTDQEFWQVANSLG